MVLDPQVQAYLNQIAALDAPRLETLPVEEARRACVADAQTLGEPEPVREVRDRTVPGPDGEIPVRIYVPQGAAEDPLPVLVYYHGGGWVTQTRYDGMIHPFIRRTAVFDQAKVALNQVADSLKQAFGTNGVEA